MSKDSTNKFTTIKIAEQRKPFLSRKVYHKSVPDNPLQGGNRCNLCNSRSQITLSFSRLIQTCVVLDYLVPLFNGHGKLFKLNSLLLYVFYFFSCMSISKILPSKWGNNLYSRVCVCVTIVGTKFLDKF